MTATNRYNTSAYNVVLRDALGGNTTVFDYADLTAATGTGSNGGQVLFSDCSAAFGTLDAAAINAADAICIGYDQNGDGAVNASDVLPQNGTVSTTLTFVVRQ
ncbi:hypothetical protein ACFP81_12370 [Deinococcus lacus]|uniref:Uncharacterized protein n=1 Tax=Deinococcus lacus TaxID=392561 RepID=A0ABW1YEF4_9DEIO